MKLRIVFVLASLASALAFLGCRSNPPVSSDAELAAQKARSKASFELALQRVQEDKLDSAEALFREALDLDPKTLERHLGLANFLAVTGREKEAFDVYRAALTVLGERPEIYEDMAFAYGELGNPSAAVASLKKANALRAQLPDTPENRQWRQRNEEGIKSLSGAP